MRTILLAAALTAARDTRRDLPATRRPGGNPEVNLEIDASGNVKER